MRSTAAGAPRFTVLSLNPAIDAEWQVDDTLWEEKNLVLAQRRWAGGKGANVARWLNFLGARAELVIPLGGAAGQELGAHLKTDGVKARVIPVKDETRVNVVITNRAGRQMRFNQPGASLRSENWKDVELAACERNGGAVLFSGSLPPKTRSTKYFDLIRLVHRQGRRVFLDCDGATLAAAVKAKPFLIKPNRHELSQWAGRPLRSLKAVQLAAEKMTAATGGWALVSLSDEGALLVNVTERFVAHAVGPKVNVINTLGAGDAALAAAADSAMRGREPGEWLRAAVAAGTAATQARPGEMVSRAVFQRIQRAVRLTGSATHLR